MTLWHWLCLFFWLAAVMALAFVAIAANPYWLIPPAIFAAFGFWTGRRAQTLTPIDSYSETFE